MNAILFFNTNIFFSATICYRSIYLGVTSAAVIASLPKDYEVVLRKNDLILFVMILQLLLQNTSQLRTDCQSIHLENRNTTYLDIQVFFCFFIYELLSSIERRCGEELTVFRLTEHTVSRVDRNGSSMAVHTISNKYRVGIVQVSAQLF